MTVSRHFDTVAFDVRDDTAMLFFAETDKSGEISRYVLLMRTITEEFDDRLYLEIDETQVAGDNVLQEAELDGNLLRLRLEEDAAKTFGDGELVLSFDDNERNHAGIQAGALRVLGSKLVGGHG